MTKCEYFSEVLHKLRDVLCLQSSEEKLSMAQEELAANRTHQTALEAQIQELKAARSTLEQELSKRHQKLHQQEQALKELQKQEVGRRV